MKIITISGVDGSGKSTQIKFLKEHLESRGKRVFYYHAIEQGMARKLVEFRNRYCLICKLTGRCKVYKEKSVTDANAFQIFLRKIFLRIDIWQFSSLHSKLCNKGYDYILSDRYFYDSIVNIAFLDSWNGPRGSNWTLEVQEPDLAIYLKTDPEIIMSRERVPDQGLEYLERKKDIYDKKSAGWKMMVLDGNRDKDVISEEIKSLVEKRIICQNP